MRESRNTLPLFFCFNMSNIIDQAIDTLYEKIMEMPNKVLDIFNNFYGVERVDMQGFVTKSRVKHDIEGMSLTALFSRANMIDKLKGAWDLSRELVDINVDLLLEDGVKELVDAISSDAMAQWFKESVQPGFILVHFPRVTVTNEYDRSTVVKHLYVKVPVDIKGAENGLFKMNRSEYTLAEMYSGYMHSHASNIPTHDFTDFTRCCLGSGPLNNTQTNLSVGFDEDRWNIFCLELSKYVEVESVAGTPYHRLENISLGSRLKITIDRLSNTSDLYFSRSRQSIKEAVMEFLSYYLDNNDLTFSFRNGVYSLGMSYVEYLIRISNAFIEWLNNNPKYQSLEESKFNDVLGKYTVINGEIYQTSESLTNTIDRYRPYIGAHICNFKGHPVTVTISDIDNISSSSENSARLLKPSFASLILNRILRTINYRYGRNQEDPSTFAGKIRYQV